MTLADILDIGAGAVTTLGLSLSGIALGLPLGFVLALARWNKVPILDGAIALYVSMLRATPIITLALFIFFVLPTWGLELGPVPAAIITLGLNTSAFNCEIWRSGLDNFARDQLEAAKVYGMSRRQTFRRIIFPQLWRSSLSPIVSEATLLLKATPAVAVIGVVEITRAATRIGAQTYQPLPPFLTATLIYTALIAGVVWVQRTIERAVERKYGSAWR
ncbi:amino acid ABC transporter permease [Thauera sinica]|uniref:Amino acid ABC transporter permease n=1 Tax=Thauera sinica TaxID=2665146 RepID=A0ABW1AKL0_9RHOO|nr:amino acid ABC transporter permease [Thauera sp. K11]ATE59835.1 ABC transporter permease [Thauera sp. K11]